MTTPNPAPVALAYLQERFLMTPAERARVIAELAQFAQRQGLLLKEIHIEKPETAPSAYQALVATAGSDDVSTVIVSKLEDLELQPGGQTRLDHLRHYARVQVLAASSPP